MRACALPAGPSFSINVQPRVQPYKAEQRALLLAHSGFMCLPVPAWGANSINLPGTCMQSSVPCRFGTSCVFSCMYREQRRDVDAPGTGGTAQQEAVCPK